MQIQISGHQVEVTPALRDYVQTRMERLGRHYDNLTSLNIVLTVEKLEHRADGTLAAAGRVLHAVANAADMYAAIDVLVDKVETQLRKHKEKLTDHHADAVRAARYS